MRARQICGGCGGFLRRPRERSIEYALVLTIGALFLFCVANIFPFLTMSIEGIGSRMYLIGAGQGLYRLGQPVVGLVVFMATFVLPTIQIAGAVFVLGSLHMGWRPPGLAWVFRLVGATRQWAMLDVFLLGVLVAYVKLSSLAQLDPGEGFYAFGGAMLLLIAAQVNMDRFHIWNEISPQMTVAEMTRHPERTVWSCHECSQLVLAPKADASGHPHCPRCDAGLHHRKPQSIGRCWALLLSAAALYVPANLLPMTTIVSLGNEQDDTIISGVVELIDYGEYPIALLILFASILVPVLKIISLAILLLTVQFRTHWRPRERTMLYRIVELVGRWSMVDVFVVGILGALVSLGALATIEPGPAIFAFASVVVLTMMAAASFDPRLIWDPVKPETFDVKNLRT